MGIKYFISSGRIMSHKGEELKVNVCSVHKMTHSYTAQYALTLSEKLLPKVFSCLQLAGGTLDPQVSNEVAKLTEEFGNVLITCLKFDKVHTDTYKQFLNSIIQLYVQKNPFLYIVDSWAGQTNPVLYESFKDENKQSSCALKIIPPECTAFCQLFDIYFYRQVKNLIRRVQNYSTSQQHCLTARRDAIRIQSLVHYHLPAPAYAQMISDDENAASHSSTTFRNTDPEIQLLQFPKNPVLKTLQYLKLFL